MGKNLEQNKKAFSVLENVANGKSVFSRDGFIEYQNGLSSIMYGDMPASHGACGAIAAWNVLKYLGIAPEKAIVFDEMEKGTIFGSRLGTEVFFVKKYLANKGRRVDMYFSLKEFKESFVSTGIVYYIKDNFRAHYVAFTPAGANEKGERLYRFHNVSAGSYWKTYDNVKYIENLPLTMDEFLKETGAKMKVFYDVR